MNTKSVALWVSTLICTAMTAPVTASESPPISSYAGQENRDIKALSPQEIADLQAGKGMGYSKVAELNHVPGPSHVIELADKLALSPKQKSDAQAAFDFMAGEAKRLGAAIVANEAALERLFVNPSALDSEEIHRTVAEIARLQGELRFVHLDAHVAMSRVLAPKQIAAYDRLRGYNATGSTLNNNPAHRHHH